MRVRGRARSVILKAARALFAERGFHGTSVGAIARRAQVDRALINYYFESKAKLFAAAIAPRISVQRLAETNNGSSAGSRIARLYVGHLFVERHEAIAGMLRAGIGDSDSVPGLSSLIREAFASGPADNGVTSSEARLRAELMAAQIVGLFIYRHILAEGPLASVSLDPLIALLGPVLDGVLGTSS